MKSRHTWQRLSLGWKVSKELRVNWKASLFCDVETTIWLFLVFLPASAIGTDVLSLRETVFPPLREAVFV